MPRSKLPRFVTHSTQKSSGYRNMSIFDRSEYNDIRIEDYAVEDVNKLKKELNQLQSVFIESTEWNLATLEELKELKSSSKLRIGRQEAICTNMVKTCESFIVKDDTRLNGLRLKKIFQGLWDKKDIHTVMNS